MTGLGTRPERFRKKNRARRVLTTALSAFLVWAGTTHAQSAFRLNSFASDEDLKSEATFSAGLALPLGPTRSFLSDETGNSRPVPKGAQTGGAVDAGYRYYALPQLSLGVSFTGHWYGYDYEALGVSAATRVKHSGWGMYALAATVGTRLPLGLYGLYFTADVQCGYALMCSPSVKAIYSSITVGDIERTILYRNMSGNLYLSGGVGVQYRFRRQWLCHLDFSYSYMPATGLGSDQPVPGSGQGLDMRMKLSSFVVGVGVAYAF